MAVRFSNLDLLKLGSPGGDANHPLVVPAVGLGYATSMLGELLRIKSVVPYPAPQEQEVEFA